MTIMTIDEVLLTSSPMQMHKKTVLNVMFAHAQIAETLSDVFKSFELSPEQFNVLRILRGQKGLPANMCLIQDRMLAKTSNTTRLVDKLLLKNYVTREVCPDNRRKIEVQITKKGLHLLEKMDPEVEYREKQIVSGLSNTEMRQLNLLLDKLRKQ